MGSNMRYVLIKWTSDDDEGTYSMMDASCIVQGLDELTFDKGNPEQDQRTVLVQRQVKGQDKHGYPICTPITKG
jgi:hypothetical protein